MIIENRTPITRDSGNINITRVPTGNGIIPRDGAVRKIATAEEMAAYNIPPASSSQITGIVRGILDNAGQYIGIPYRQGSDANVVSPSIPNTFYGNQDPFSVLSDVFRNVFGSGGDIGQRTQTGQALVPVTSTRGSNSLVIILIVSGIGGMIYYFYKKRNQ